MSEFKIEKGVPRPRRGRAAVYPWDNMEPGDSFFVSCADEKRRSRQMSLYSAGCNWLKRNRSPSWSVSTRQEDGGVRIWFFGPGDESSRASDDDSGRRR